MKPLLKAIAFHAALAYYWDHQTELDADIRCREDYVQNLEQEAGESAFVARLRAIQFLPL